MPHLDIIIYAAIAVLLLARLWAVFGRRNDEDTERPNPFVAPPASENDEVMVRPRAKDAPAALSVPQNAAPASLAGGLEQVARLDPNFDEKKFLQNARAIFTAVVSGFSGGDLAPCRRMLGAGVLPHFEAAIAARAKAGEKLAGRITRIRDAEVTAARVEGSRAVLAVRFLSEQENVLSDAAGKIISGAPGKSEEIADQWVFARDTKGGDWQVIETR